MECEKDEDSEVIFTDKEFGYDFESILGFGENIDKFQLDLSLVRWIRAKDLFLTVPFSLFQKIESQDIFQGDLGNCYYLCAVSSIAE